MIMWEISTAGMSRYDARPWMLACQINFQKTKHRPDPTRARVSWLRLLGGAVSLQIATIIGAIGAIYPNFWALHHASDRPQITPTHDRYP